VCSCDMFPEPHPAGWAADGVVCELALPGTQISPHLANVLSQMWADAEQIATGATFTEDQAAALRQIVEAS